MELKDYLPVWNKLTEKERTALENSAARKTLKKGTVIHGGNQNCSGLYIIISGEIRVYTLSDSGREITVYRLFDRDICLFSASCMLNSIQFELIIETQKDTDVFFLPAEIYKKIMADSAPLANFTNELLSSRFTEVMWLLDQILWKSFDKRLAGFLLEESAIQGSDTLKITHEEIGNHLGNPREVVTRMLRYFAGEGMVELTRGTIKLTDVKKLQRI